MALAIAKDSNSKPFEKSDRAINFNFPVTNADGSPGYVKLATAWLKISDSDQAMLIKAIDEAPDSLAELFAEMAKVSTYVDVAKAQEQKKERSLPFSLTKRTA